VHIFMERTVWGKEKKGTAKRSLSFGFSKRGGGQVDISQEGTMQGKERRGAGDHCFWAKAVFEVLVFKMSKRGRI